MSDQPSVIEACCCGAKIELRVLPWGANHPEIHLYADFISRHAPCVEAWQLMCAKPLMAVGPVPDGVAG
jgi:hypothetical protein